ncbi:MAG: hypothetical protein JO061_04150 [Acidobacteriaceae bacterium]|nr:hypothetical protein [Acidobacteriaceae bacterium]
MLVFLAGFVVRIWLIWLFPHLYGGDTVLHLRNHNRILLAHQLPALQSLIYLLYKVSPDPFLPRLLMACLGAGAGVGFYLLLTCIVTPASALCGALLFVTNPFLNEISIVPFQEILMLGALSFAAYFYVRGRIYVASACLALACLTRYEAWIACPCFAYLWIRRNDPVVAWGRVRQFGAAVILFCWAPALWILFHHGFSPAGTVIVDFPRSGARLVRWVYLGWITVRNTPIIDIALSAVGLVAIWKRKLLLSFEGQAFTGFFVMFLIAIVFSAHGDLHHRTSADPERFVTSREAAIPVSIALLLAAFGVEALLRNLLWSRTAGLAAAVGIGCGILQSKSFVAEQTARPEIQLSYAVATYLDRNVRADEKVLLLAKPFSSEERKFYVGHEGQRSGMEMSAAEPDGRNVDMPPFDFQCTAVQSRLQEDQIVATDEHGTAQWLVLWSNAPQDSGVAGKIQGSVPVERIIEGSLFATVYHRPNSAGYVSAATTSGRAQ